MQLLAPSPKPDRKQSLADQAVLRPLRVGLLLSAIGRHGGGVSISAQALAIALAERPGVAVSAFAMDAHDQADEIEDWRPVELKRFAVRGPAVFGYAPGLLSGLLAADLDVLHVHGVWTYASVASRIWSRRTGRPYVVSPHGMLDPWAVASRGRKKALALALYERGHLDGAALLHALCDSERDAIGRLRLKPELCVIPNGVTMPAEEFRRAKARKILLFFGRVTEKKGVAALVEAWAKTSRAPAASDWELVIAGGGEAGFVDDLVRSVRRLGIADSVRFVGHKSGAAKTETFRDADAFILPSVSEGQPLAVLEAWSFSLPALITAECNLPEGFAAGAAVKISSAPQPLAEELARFFAMTEGDRTAMGRRGAQLAARRFSWSTAAADWEKTYRGVVYGGDQV